MEEQKHWTELELRPAPGSTKIDTWLQRWGHYMLIPTVALLGGIGVVVIKLISL